jgi:hypothetical protein
MSQHRSFGRIGSAEQAREEEWPGVRIFEAVLGFAALRAVVPLEERLPGDQAAVLGDHLPRPLHISLFAAGVVAAAPALHPVGEGAPLAEAHEVPARAGGHPAISCRQDNLADVAGIDVIRLDVHARRVEVELRDVDLRLAALARCARAMWRRLCGGYTPTGSVLRCALRRRAFPWRLEGRAPLAGLFTPVGRGSHQSASRRLPATI